MVSRPDAAPDSPPPAQSDDVEQLSPENPPLREDVEGGTGAATRTPDRGAGEP